jgi:hypothetical protein
MKKIAILLIFLFNYSALFSDTGDILKRRQAIQDYKIKYDKIMSETNTISTEINNFSDPKMTISEKDGLKELKEKIEKQKSELDSSSSYLDLDYVDKKIKSLQELDKSIATYEAHQKSVKDIEDGTYSKRMELYLKEMGRRKYVLAKAAYLTLSSEEKAIADEYDKSWNYVAANAQPYEVGKKEKISMEKNIAEDFLLHENGISEIKKQYDDVKTSKAQLENLKKDLSQEQIEIKIRNTYDLGSFICNEFAIYSLSHQYPGVLLIKNGSALRSIVKINPNEVKGFNVVEQSFEHIQDKVICRIDPSCQSDLKQMDSYYKRDEMFLSVKDQIIAEQLEASQPNMKKALGIFKEFNKLGYFTEEEIENIYSPMIQISKEITDVKNSSEYLVKIQKKIEDYRKTLLADLDVRDKKSPDSTKKKDSELMINYLVKSTALPAVESVLKSGFIDDQIQKSAYKNCQNPDLKFPDFCSSSKLWREKVKEIQSSFFDVKDIAGQKCDPVILRYSKQVPGREESCDPVGEIHKLESDVKNIINKVDEK